MRAYLITFIICFGFNVLNAQRLYGTISDSLSNKPLAYVNLSVLHSNYGTSTDSVGNFVFNIDKHSNGRLLISILGYQPKTIALNQFSEANNLLNIRLVPAITDLDDVLLVYKKKRYSATKSLGVKRQKIKFKSSVPIGYERCVFIENETSRKGKIKSVSFKVKKGASDIYDVYPVYFRIKFYQKDKYASGPGTAISFYDSVLKPANKNQTIKLKFDDTFIPFLESGIFVGIETLNPEPIKPSKSMYITVPNLVMTYNDEPLTYSSYRGQPWTHMKRIMKWKAFGKTTYYYTNPLVELEVQFEK